MKSNKLSTKLTKLLKGHKIIFLFIVFSIFTLTTNAQFFEELSNPQVTFNLEHPPGLGLKVNKIAFGPATGNCSDQIIQALITDFTNNNVEVLDREHLNTMLSEHNLSLSGYVDKTSAAAIGKILGPSALIFVRVQRCATQVDRLIGKKNVRYNDGTTGTIPLYIARTRAFLQGSLQTVDLTTGRIFAAQSFNYSPDRSNESTEGYPEAPATFDVQDDAFRMVVLQIHRMFLPWKEQVVNYFYDDKNFNLKTAYQALSAGNLDLAFDISQKNLEECKKSSNAKPKNLEHAYYNLGMTYMFKSDYDKALENFTEAQKIKPGSILTQAIANCTAAKRLMTAMQQVDEKATIAAQASQAEEVKAAQETQASTITNNDIIQMSNNKLPSAIIIQKIKTSNCKFDTSSDALVQLTKAGVNEQVVMAMMEKK